MTSLSRTTADFRCNHPALPVTSADNNVHPSNMMQFITSLQKSGKSFDVQVGPDRGHSGINTERMMEFFIENLVMRNPGAATAF